MPPRQPYYERRTYGCLQQPKAQLSSSAKPLTRVQSCLRGRTRILLNLILTLNLAHISGTILPISLKKCVGFGEALAVRRQDWGGGRLPEKRVLTGPSFHQHLTARTSPRICNQPPLTKFNFSPLLSLPQREESSQTTPASTHTQRSHNGSANTTTIARRSSSSWLAARRPLPRTPQQHALPTNAPNHHRPRQPALLAHLVRLRQRQRQQQHRLLRQPEAGLAAEAARQPPRPRAQLVVRCARRRRSLRAA